MTQLLNRRGRTAPALARPSASCRPGSSRVSSRWILGALAALLGACAQGQPHVSPSAPPAVRPPPIIDMHMHAMPIAGFAELLAGPPVPHCVPMTSYPGPDADRSWLEIFQMADPPCDAIWSPVTDDEALAATLEIMQRRNIVAAVTSGPLLQRWRQAAPELIIPSLLFGPGPQAPSVDTLREWFTRGDYAVLGEVTAQYAGIAADDPEMAPYWALAEELDFPVNIHIGTGPVGAPHAVWPAYRARLHSPLQLEEVLVRHPRLRIFIGHAAWPMLDDLLAVLWTHPQLHLDVSVINWALPRPEFHRYLRRIVEAGFGKRILFGSDQMVWPDAIGLAIEAIESADFLTEEQRRDILYNNAARFLRLSDDEIARHHGRPVAQGNAPGLVSRELAGNE
jgi:uncharacterized protein